MAAELCSERAAERVGFRLRQELFDHAMALSLRWHDRNRAGEILSRLTTDVGRVLDALVAIAVTLVPDAVRVAVVLALLVTIDPQLALVGLAVVPLLAVLAVRQRRRVRGAQHEARTQSGRLSALTTDLLRNVRAVQAFGRRHRTGNVFAARNRALLDANLAGCQHVGALGTDRRCRARGRIGACARRRWNPRGAGTDEHRRAARRHELSGRALLTRARIEPAVERARQVDRERSAPARRVAVHGRDHRLTGRGHRTCATADDPLRCSRLRLRHPTRIGRVRSRPARRRDRVPVRAERRRQEHRAASVAAPVRRRRGSDHDRRRSTSER